MSIIFGGDGGEGQGRPGCLSGCGVRAVLALMFVLMAFGTYYCNTQTNPFTGEKQHVALTPQQEVRLGLQSAPEMAAQMGGVLPEDDPQSQLVRRVGERLVQAIDIPNDPYRFSFHVLADRRTINAFSLPGGPVFITKALLDQLGSEAQVAGVLGHEVGHVIERHAAEHMANQQFYQQLVNAAGVGAGSYSAAQIADYVATVRQLSYSRKDELEADGWGLRLLPKLNYDPRAMLDVMKTLERATHGVRGSDIFATHPDPEARMERIRE